MFKIGTTSYIFPADISTNVKKLAGRVNDIELVLFELEKESNFPDRPLINELIDVRERYNTSYTIHLPLDLALGGDKPDIEKAARVIRMTSLLKPAGYVVHLDGAREKDQSKHLADSLDSLKALGGVVDDPSLLCIENLEHEPPDFIDMVLEAAPVSTCIDIGHLWKGCVEPLPILAKRLDRTRIVHLHGLRGRDHQSVSFVAPRDLDPITSFLLPNYHGILTIEVFSEADFSASVAAIKASLERVSTDVSDLCGTLF